MLFSHCKCSMEMINKKNHNEKTTCNDGREKRLRSQSKPEESKVRDEYMFPEEYSSLCKLFRSFSYKVSLKTGFKEIKINKMWELLH